MTQQLIKNNIFAGGNEDSFGEKLERKLQEQYLALQLEKIMDKEIILKNYLNTINLGNNTLGVKSAAKRYFGKDVSDLTLSECHSHCRYHPEPYQIQSYCRKKVKKTTRKSGG